MLARLTLHCHLKQFQPTDVTGLPLILKEDEKDMITRLSEENLKLAEDDWDSFEISWDFIKHPLVEIASSGNARSVEQAHPHPENSDQTYSQPHRK